MTTLDPEKRLASALSRIRAGIRRRRAEIERLRTEAARAQAVALLREPGVLAWLRRALSRTELP